MEKHHRQLINLSMPQLINCTRSLESVVNKLLEKDVINKWMKDYILDPVEETVTKKIRLYQVIQGRGPKAFLALCETLEETSNLSALTILEKGQAVASVRALQRELNNFLISQNSDIVLSEENNDEPYVKIHPDLLRMDINDENLPTGAYPMGSNPKGHALILNINKVIDRNERKGSEVDVDNLQKLFNGLGFIVQSEVDLSEREIKNVIKEFVENWNNVKTDSVVVFIMSHGEAGKDSTRSSDFMSADGIPINTDWIIEQFKPDKIPSHIPKLFFIQACRGNNSDYGWRNSSENSRLENDTNDLPGTVTNRRYENVFIAYATVPGYNAKRDPVDGSWFVQKLCEVVRENAWKYDLNSMMKMVDIEIRKLNSLFHGFQTTEWTNRGFNKKFYFNPGLYNNSSDHDHSMTTPE